MNRKEFLRKNRVEVEKRQEEHREEVNKKLIGHKYGGLKKEGETRDDR